MPGSTFKVITTGIALESGVATLETQFPSEREWVPPQTTDPIQNYNGSLCGGDLATVFARSCNIPFAQLSTFLGPEAMIAGTEAWGIGEPLPIDLPRPIASTFGNTDDLAQELPLLAIQLARARCRWCHSRIGHGGRRRRERRPDDDAVRRRIDLRPGRRARSR